MWSEGWACQAPEPSSQAQRVCCAPPSQFPGEKLSSFWHRLHLLQTKGSAEGATASVHWTQSRQVVVP